MRDPAARAWCTLRPPFGEGTANYDPLYAAGTKAVLCPVHLPLPALTLLPATLPPQPCYKWWEVPYYWAGLKVGGAGCLRGAQDARARDACVGCRVQRQEMHGQRMRV